jgi:hypothetical protein
MARTAVASSDYASRSDICGLTAYPITMACWFNPANVTAIHPLITLTNSASTDDSLIMWIRGDAAGDYLAIRAAQNAAATQEATNSSGSVVAGSWQHACAIFESATVRHIHLNGVCTQNAGTSVVLPTGMNRTTLGASIRSSGTIVASADIAFAAIWNVALTEAEVQRLAAGVHPMEIRNSAIVAAWNCKRVAAPEPDQKGTYDLTATGTFALAASDPTIVYGKPRFITQYKTGGDMADRTPIQTITGTVSSTALTLSTFGTGFSAANQAIAKGIMVSCITGDVMVSCAPSFTPTASNGHPVVADGPAFPIECSRGEGYASNFRVIRRTVDATVTISLYA